MREKLAWLLALVLALMLGRALRTSSRLLAQEPLEVSTQPADELTQLTPQELAQMLRGERTASAKREAGLLRELEELRTELAVERANHVEREAEWLDYTRLLSALPVPEAPDAPEFMRAQALADMVRPDPAVAAAERAAQARAYEIRRDLRALLAAEQVYSLEVLEVGRLNKDWTGPFVARIVDEYGRPVGNLAAERMRLERSHSARTVTLVFEEGYENRAGERSPFAGTVEKTSTDPWRTGVRRIHLPGVDPEPWIAALPELFGDLTLSAPMDDGTQDHGLLRARLNELLIGSSGGSRWRLHSLGGVWRGELRDVQLVEFGAGNSVLRRLFADRLLLRREGQGVRLDLHDGVQLRSDQRVPFLDGRFPVVLPRADGAKWSAAGLPGMTPPEVLDPVVDPAEDPKKSLAGTDPEAGG
ncbi:MAG: hypothetical protein ACI8QC_001772 [Planctomycetota bacterium]|jgi:hypothetical protein